MNNIWDKVIKQYPNIREVLDTLYKRQLDLANAIEELEKKYPVEGYEWECDPNSIGVDVNPWYLVSKQRQDEIIKRTNERLKRQKNCVDGKHEFVNIASIQWCKYCGTLKVSKIPKTTIEDKYFYPECPHFLPKEDK